MASANFRTIHYALFFIALIAFSCTDEPSSVADETRALLKAKTWSVKSVELNGVSESSQFEGLQLKFDDQEYTVWNGGLIWGGGHSLSWTLQKEDAKSFAIGTGPEVHIEKLTQSAMKLRLNWDPIAYGGGATTPVKGLYVFEFQ